MVPIQKRGIWSDGVVGIGSVPGVTDGVVPEVVVIMVGGVVIMMAMVAGVVVIVFLVRVTVRK